MQVRIWDVASGDLVTSLQGHQGGVLSLAANATADVIASCSTDESLKLWGASNGALIANRGHDSGVPLAVLNEDGSLVCSGTITGQIMLSRTADGAVRGQLRRPPLPPSALALAPAVAASLQGNTVQVWSRQAGTRLHLLDAGTKSTLDFVTMTPEGALVVAATRDGTLRVWDVLTGKLRTALEAASATDDAASGHRQWVRSDMSSHLSVAEKQRRRSIARRTAEAREVEMTTGPMREISVPIVSAIAVDDAGVQVAVGWMTGDVEVIDVGSGSVKSLEEHAGKLTAIAFAPGGSIVATGTDEGCVRLWDVETGVLRATLSGATAQVGCRDHLPSEWRLHTIFQVNGVCTDARHDCEDYLPCVERIYCLPKPNPSDSFDGSQNVACRTT